MVIAIHHTMFPVLLAAVAGIKIITPYTYSYVDFVGIIGCLLTTSLCMLNLIRSWSIISNACMPNL
eukprot:13777356-Ditylum_brightwellii.AAC.1